MTSRSIVAARSLRSLLVFRRAFRRPPPSGRSPLGPPSSQALRAAHFVRYWFSGERSARRGLAILGLAILGLACGEPPPTSNKTLEPRRPVALGTREPGQDSVDMFALAPMPESETAGSGRDPQIDRALELIRTSGRRFLAPDSDPAAAPDEYTAAQFAKTLETKRDWIGYDITQFDPWLDEIASSSFVGRVPYLVVLDDGSTRELRAWLLERLTEPEPEPEPEPS